MHSAVFDSDLRQTSGRSRPGKLIAPLALRSARKGADDFGKTIKTAVEAS